jgi:SlyX protein
MKEIIMNDERFIKIETTLVHQEAIIEELHQVLYQQQETIFQLQKKIKLFEDQVSADSNIRAAGEKPPHY